MSSAEQWREAAGSLSIRHRAFIGGAFVDPESGATRSNFSAIDGAVLCEVAECQEVDLDRAVTEGQEVFDKRTWRGQSLKERKRVLLRLAELIETHARELALLESLDTGKPISDSLSVDVPLSAECFRWYAEVLDKRHDEFVSTNSGNSIAITREPLGVVGAIVPWNFPLLMASWKIAPALSIGNSVVLKPSELAPLTAIRLGELAVCAGIPDGAFNVCPGGGPTVGRWLASHPNVACISFTGSVNVGRELLKYSGESNMKRVWIESGGKNAQVVLDESADIRKAAEAIAWGAFYNQGEMCSAGSRVIVHRSVYDELMEALLPWAERLRPMDPLNPDAKTGALISRSHLESVTRAVDAARELGRPVLTGGQQCSVIDGGHYYPPTIVDDVLASDRIFQDELFGPVLTITKAESAEEAIALANQTKYGLTAAVWSGRIDRAMAAARMIQSGTVWVNCYDRADFAVPFGGFGLSGFGRAKSLHALEKYSDLKATWIEHGTL